MPRIRYKKPPLTEAVVECFFEPVAWTDGLRDRMLETIPENERATVEQGDIQSVSFQVGPAAAHSVTHRPRLRCWNKDRTHLIQFGPDMIAFNVLSEYTSFDDYLPKLESLFQNAVNVFGFSAVQWIGQRYVNQFSIPKDRLPENTFAIYPILPSRVRDGHPPFALQVETLKDNEKTVALNLEYRGLLGDAQAYTLDIYLRSLNFKSVDAKQMAAWMDSAHDSAFSTFDAALTEEAKNSFERF